jgi:hypothetical protein
MLLTSKGQPKEAHSWTLFGPYTTGRWRPLRNGPQQRINGLCRPRTPGTAQNALEVLAGAISCGKPPSPHHILKDLRVSVWTLFS